VGGVVVVDLWCLEMSVMSLLFLGADGSSEVAGLEVLLGDAAPVWEVVDLVDQLDLSLFEAVYRADGSGGRPYDPRLMVVAVLWCYRLGIRSPRAIAGACRDRVDLRVVLGGRTPSEPTVRRFVRGRAGAWQRLQVEVLGLCARAGLVDVSITATDGSPVGAPAALSANRSLAWVDARIGRVEEELAAVLARQQMVVADLDVDLDAAVGEVDGQVDGFLDEVCDRLRRQEEQVRRRLSRLRAARQVAAGRAQRRAHDPRRIDKLREWVDRHERTLTEMIEVQQARLDARAAREAVGQRVPGPRPVGIEAAKHINRQREALTRAQRALARALGGDEP